MFCFHHTGTCISVRHKKGNNNCWKSKTETAKKETEKKPVWTLEDESARKIQTAARGYLARRELKKLKKEREEYEELMDKLEKEVDFSNAILTL